MREQFDFDFIRGNIFTTATDRVLETIDEEEIAIIVAKDERVAGVKPPIAPGIGSGLRIAVVPVVHCPRLLSPDDKLTHSALGTSQSFSSTSLTSTPDRGRPQVPGFTGFSLDRSGVLISVMLNSVKTSTSNRLLKAGPL